MAFLISTVYSVVLGTLFRNFVLVRIDGSPPGTVVVTHLIRKTNWKNTISLLLLFFVDWVVFLVIFPPGQPFTLDFRELLLLVFYLPALATLGTAVVASLEDSRRYCVPLALYHGLGGVAEIIWLIAVGYAVDTITGDTLGPVIAFVAVYVIIRGGLAVGYYFLANPTRTVEPIILAPVALLAKPAVVLLVSFFPAFTDAFRSAI